MTNDVDVRNQAVTVVLKGVARKSALIVAPAAIAVFMLEMVRGSERWWFLPSSMLFGGALGLLNFRWLAIAVQKIYLRQGATPGLSNLAAAIINILKLSAIFIILFVVIKWRLVHVFGLVGGLSLCFLAVIWEGATALQNNSKDRE